MREPPSRLEDWRNSGCDDIVDVRSPAEYAHAEAGRAPILFDPQTAGPLLAVVPQKQADACPERLKAGGCGESAVIGRILERRSAPESGPGLRIR